MALKVYDWLLELSFILGPFLLANENRGKGVSVFPKGEESCCKISRSYITATPCVHFLKIRAEFHQKRLLSCKVGSSHVLLSNFVV